MKINGIAIAYAIKSNFHFKISLMVIFYQVFNKNIWNWICFISFLQLKNHNDKIQCRILFAQYSPGIIRSIDNFYDQFRL